MKSCVRTVELSDPTPRALSDANHGTSHICRCQVSGPPFAPGMRRRPPRARWRSVACDGSSRSASHSEVARRPPSELFHTPSASFTRAPPGPGWGPQTPRRNCGYLLAKAGGPECPAPRRIPRRGRSCRLGSISATAQGVSIGLSVRLNRPTIRCTKHELLVDRDQILSDIAQAVVVAPWRASDPAPTQPRLGLLRYEPPVTEPWAQDSRRASSRSPPQSSLGFSPSGNHGRRPAPSVSPCLRSRRRNQSPRWSPAR